MKITKSQLKQIVKEELEGVLNEAQIAPPEASGQSVDRIEKELYRRDMYSDDLAGRRKLAKAIDIAVIALGERAGRDEKEFLDWVQFNRTERGDTASEVAGELLVLVKQDKGYQK